LSAIAYVELATLQYSESFDRHVLPQVITI
jgi:hypothetical protein